MANGALDHEFEMFQRGLPGLQSNWWDTMNPAVRQAQQQQTNHFNNGPSPAQQGNTAWAADFSNAQLSFHPNQQRGMQAGILPNTGAGAAHWARDFRSANIPQAERSSASQPTFRPRFRGMSPLGYQRPMGYTPSMNMGNSTTQEKGKGPVHGVDGKAYVDPEAFEKEFEALSMEMKEQALDQETVETNGQTDHVGASTDDAMIEDIDEREALRTHSMARRHDAEAERLREESLGTRQLANELAEEYDTRAYLYLGIEEWIRLHTTITDVEQSLRELDRLIGAIKATSPSLEQSRRLLQDAQNITSIMPLWQNELLHVQSWLRRERDAMEAVVNEDCNRATRQAEDEELAQVAGNLLECVSENDSDKFRNSSFMALMRQIHGKEVRIVGQDFVSTGGREHEKDEGNSVSN